MDYPDLDVFNPNPFRIWLYDLIYNHVIFSEKKALSAFQDRKTLLLNLIKISNEVTLKVYYISNPDKLVMHNKFTSLSDCYNYFKIGLDQNDYRVFFVDLSKQLGQHFNATIELTTDSGMLLTVPCTILFIPNGSTEIDLDKEDLYIEPFKSHLEKTI